MRGKESSSSFVYRDIQFSGVNQMNVNEEIRCEAGKLFKPEEFPFNSADEVVDIVERALQLPQKR
jgi:hypothetical protein